MKWLRRVIRDWIGRDRYHEQAQEVGIRQLRADLMKQRAYMDPVFHEVERVERIWGPK